MNTVMINRVLLENVVGLSVHFEPTACQQELAELKEFLTATEADEVPVGEGIFLYALMRCIDVYVREKKLPTSDQSKLLWELDGEIDKKVIFVRGWHEYGQQQTLSPKVQELVKDHLPEFQLVYDPDHQPLYEGDKGFPIKVRWYLKVDLWSKSITIDPEITRDDKTLLPEKIVVSLPESDELVSMPAPSFAFDHTEMSGYTVPTASTMPCLKSEVPLILAQYLGKFEAGQVNDAVKIYKEKKNES